MITVATEASNKGNSADLNLLSQQERPANPVWEKGAMRMGIRFLSLPLSPIENRATLGLSFRNVNEPARYLVQRLGKS